MALPLSALLLLGSVIPAHAKLRDNDNSSLPYVAAFAGLGICCLSSYAIYKLLLEPVEDPNIAYREQEELSRCIRQCVEQKQFAPDKYDLQLGIEHCMYRATKKQK